MNPRRYQTVCCAAVMTLCLMTTGLALAQGEEDLDLDLGDVKVEETTVKSVEPPLPVPTLARGLSLPGYLFPKAHTAQFLVDHRPRQALVENPLRDGLGFDRGGFKIDLSIRAVVLDFLEVYVLRQNQTSELFDTYLYGARFRLLEQSKHFLSLVVGGSLAHFAQPEIDDGVAGNAHLVLGHTAPYGIELALLGLYSSDSSSLSKANIDTDWSVGMGAHLAWNPPWLQWLQVSAEMAFPLAGYDAGHPALTAGVTFLTYRHAFSILVSNTQLITDDALPAGADRALDDLILGFCIVRQFGE